MNPHRPNGLAAKIAHYVTSLLPPELKDWGMAMRYELDAIPSPQKATVFAIGCLFFALRQRIAYSGKHVLGHLLDNPYQVVALCAILATGLGLVHLALANAPVRYLIMNASALGLGFMIVALVMLVARNSRVRWGLVSTGLAALVLLTSLFGINAEGATRWVSLGDVSIQSSFLVVPLVALIFAREQSMLTTLAIIVTSIALAMQPDRGMSGALAAGMIALALVQHMKRTMIASGAAISGFVAAMLRADTLPATPFVDQIYFSSFSLHPLAGLAVLAGAALLLAPAVVGGLSGRSDFKIYVVFGAVWGAISIAAALGNYPTPILGYGGSAIIGYVMCVLGFAVPQKRSSLFGDGGINADGHAPPAANIRAALA